MEREKKIESSASPDPSISEDLIIKWKKEIVCKKIKTTKHCKEHKTTVK